MNQMAKGLLFGAAVLSQAAAGCFPAAAASIDRVRIRLAAEELDEMGMPVLEAESRDRAYSVTGVERISGDPASGPAMDGAEVGKKENEQYKGSIQADSENIGTKEVSLEGRKIEEIHAEEPAPEILYEIELESDADDSFSVLRQEDIQFSGLGAVCSKAVRKDNGTTLLLTIDRHTISQHRRRCDPRQDLSGVRPQNRRIHCRQRHCSRRHAAARHRNTDIQDAFQKTIPHHHTEQT